MDDGDGRIVRAVGDMVVRSRRQLEVGLHAAKNLLNLRITTSCMKKGGSRLPPSCLVRVGRQAAGYSSGVFGMSVQMPHGQAPAQKPQPMHFSLSQTMANSLSGKA